MKNVLIYSGNFCPYCDMAKNLLSTKGVEYTEKNAQEEMDTFMELAQKYGQTSVPMIFIGNEFVGGFDQLKALHDAGTLDAMLAD